MKKKGFWFYGLSGSGKTFASLYLKKKINNALIIDGDEVRKNISYDLQYNLKDREIQITRILGLAKISLKSNIIPIISTVYLNKKTLKKAMKLGIIVKKIERNMNNIFKNHPTYKNKKDIVGKDIFYKGFKTDIIRNDVKKNFIASLKKLV